MPSNARSRRRRTPRAWPTTRIACGPSGLALTPERRSHLLLPLWVLLSGGAFVGTDVLILHFTLALSPGDDRLHWLTASAVALGLLAFAHASGWLWAVACSHAPRDWASRGGLALVGGAVSALALSAFWALQQFRAQALMRWRHRTASPLSTRGSSFSSSSSPTWRR